MDRLKLLKLAKKTGRELYKTATSGQDHYAIICEDGSVHTAIQQTCFGRFGTFGETLKRKTKSPPVFMVFTHQNYKITPAYYAFIEWVMKRSPYAKVFITKGPKIATNEAIVLDCRYSPQMVIGAAVLARFRHQLPSVIDNWFEFRKYMDENLAIVYASCFKVIGHLFIPQNYNHGHALFNAMYTNSERITGFLNRKMCLKQKKLSEGNFAYSDYLSAWTKEGAQVGGSFAGLKPGTPVDNMSIKCIWTNKTNVFKGWFFKDIDKHIANFLKENQIAYGK